MSSADVPAEDAERSSGAREADTARAAAGSQKITRLTLALMTTSSVASLRASPTIAVYGLAGDEAGQVALEQVRHPHDGAGAGGQPLHSLPRLPLSGRLHGEHRLVVEPVRRHLSHGFPLVRGRAEGREAAAPSTTRCATQGKHCLTTGDAWARRARGKLSRSCWWSSSGS